MLKTPAAVAALMAMTLAMPAAGQVANDDDTLALASILDNNSFDRAQLMIANQVQYWQPVFDTLLVRDPDGSVAVNMASSYAYNDDNTILSLTLREGITFTDGEPFNAEAVRANLEYLRDGNGQNSYMAAPIEEIEIVSEHELRLHLSEPDPSLVVNLTWVGGAMASPASLGAEGAANTPVGSGAYVYDAGASVSGRQYVYVRNPDYWNPDAYPFGRISITPINDLVARLNALKSGQVDGGLGEAGTVADAEANRLETHPNSVDWLGLTLADRGGKLAPPLADLRVRQAINMAFDADAILEFYDRGYGRVSDQIFPPTSGAYLEDLDAVYDYDPEAARTLLAEAGYGDGITIAMPALASYANLNPIIEQQLAAIGVTVDWATIAPNGTIPELRSGRYPVFLLQFGYQNDWSEMTKFLLPTSPWNPVGYEDADMLAMLEAAQYATGEDQMAQFQAINRYLVENAWFAPWYSRQTIYHTNTTVDVAVQTGNVVPFIRNYSRQE